jgi:hypothetical protein
MLVTCCPRCETVHIRQLQVLGAFNDADYYRCDQCAHIWTVDRVSGAVIHHVTPLIRQEHEAQQWDWWPISPSQSDS